MKLKAAVFIVLAAAVTSATAYAHHSFAGTYIEVSWSGSKGTSSSSIFGIPIRSS